VTLNQSERCLQRKEGDDNFKPVYARDLGWKP